MIHGECFMANIRTESGPQANLAHQVIRHIYKQIQDGRLKTGDKLPTNRDLAKELNVSILTVQRAMKQLEAQKTVSCHRRTGTFLTNSENISSPKIQSGLIGLFCPELFDDFHSDLLLELERGTMEQGKLLSINFTHSHPEREVILLRSLARQRLEALVYFTSPLVVSSESYNRAVSEWIRRYIEEGTFVLFADLCPQGFENRLISLDNAKAGQMLTEKLIERGHKKIAYLGVTHLPTSRERFDGHCKAMKKEGLPFHDDWLLDIRIIEGENWEAQMEARIRNMLDLYPDLTGFNVDNQATAETVRRVLSEQSGKRKFSVNDSIAALFETGAPPFEALSWIQIPGKKMGEKAVEILLQDHPADYEPGRIKIKPVFWK
jgi:DNA-binding LacI/PurR family transcriptional regulator